MYRNRDIRPFGVKMVWCEVASASFLFGAYFESIGISLTVLGLAGLALHLLFTKYVSEKWIAALVTFVWLMGVVMWGSWLDHMAATSYITVIMTLLVGIVSFWGNTQLLQWPEIDRWFHSSPSQKD